MTKETCMEVDRLKIADAVQNKFDVNELKVYSRKYIWWKSPDDAISCPQRVIAQVMNIGDYEDVQKLLSKVTKDRLVLAVSAVKDLPQVALLSPKLHTTTL